MPNVHLRITLSRSLLFCLPLCLVSAGSIAYAQQHSAQVVVFQQAGFPTIASQPVPSAVLTQVFGPGAATADLAALEQGDVLHGARLLVLPYGSAVPVAAWPAVARYLQNGGNLLLIGGQPLRVPVTSSADGQFVAAAPQDTYSRLLGIRHSYAVPMDQAPTHFAWRNGYSFLPETAVHATQIFAEEGRLDGLGYLVAPDGTKVAAPVIVAEHGASRIIALPFTPKPGYWGSPDGERLLTAAGKYAAAGPAAFSIEVEYAALRPGEVPQVTLHLRTAQAATAPGSARVEMLEGDRVIATATVPLGGAQAEATVPFNQPMPLGLYTLRAIWTPGGQNTPQEAAQNGFTVETLASLETGEALGVNGNYLSLGGKPFLPVGTNYFTTDENGWDFSGPRNDATWEHDFADMERHGVTFVRTGIWGPGKSLLDPATGEVTERFLRNLEAYLSAAHRHHIAVNFTCFAMWPRVHELDKHTGHAEYSQRDTNQPPLPNPYLDPTAVAAEHTYLLSIVHRFGKVPWFSYDLINEPSFSNPHLIFHGNVPNNDPVEVSDWQQWLQKRYSSLTVLADAWRVTPGQLGGWNQIPLPKLEDMGYSRNEDPDGVRALDYNLFAQDMFSGWVHALVAAIRNTGSTQLVNVGQDEGGISDRLLNQFYATAGVAFTTDHTYWQDDALLWDSVAAKRPGMPNITGETGYQPAWNPDGSWRYDELTGTAIEERKWALGFAAGSSGAMQWDWAREVDFGMERSDGSAKVWENMMRDLGAFARAAAPYAAGQTLPQVALVLPQSLQMSTYKSQATEAQQTAVRVLYQYDRAEAYAVGEYQMDTLGSPKLIVLPSAYGLTDTAWDALEAKVRQGAVLLISGPFSEDAHLHPTGRARKLGLDTTLAPLQQRDDTLHGPFGDLTLRYGGMKTTILDRAILPGDKDWAELPLGKGRILFSAYPLELNDNLESIARVYTYALKAAGVQPTYTTPVQNPGILICPTRLPQATLYVLTSETATMPVAFTDTRSNTSFTGTLDAGRAALLLVGEKGDLLASYHWHPSSATQTAQARQ
jgi:hypothetical protein